MALAITKTGFIANIIGRSWVGIAGHEGSVSTSIFLKGKLNGEQGGADPRGDQQTHTRRA